MTHPGDCDCVSCWAKRSPGAGYVGPKVHERGMPVFGIVRDVDGSVPAHRLEGHARDCRCVGCHQVRLDKMRFNARYGREPSGAFSTFARPVVPVVDFIAGPPLLDAVDSAALAAAERIRTADQVTKERTLKQERTQWFVQGFLTAMGLCAASAAIGLAVGYYLMTH